MSGPTLSVVVPTRNRSAQLAETVRSIVPQVLADGAAEVLVVDDASSDDTAAVAAALAREHRAVRALRCEDPGLLAGRHLGAAESRGGVLVYVDDDILAGAGWLAAYRDAFRDPGVGIACGPCLPLWEGEEPWWLELFRQEVPGGWAIPTLSLIDRGAVGRDVDPGTVYGCNFAIRAELVRACGGFHPDAVPRESLAFRGDGESALAAAVAASGRRLRHAPGARVRHRVPRERLTVDYFLWRSFAQGVSNSYAALRGGSGAPAQGNGPASGVPPFSGRALRALRSVARLGPVRWLEGRRLLRAFAAARAAGERWHREAVARDPVIREWVLRHDYLADARLPSPSRSVLEFPQGVPS